MGGSPTIDAGAPTIASDDDAPGRAPTGQPRGGADDVPLLAAGTLVNDRYRVVEVVGRGGMGIVYRVDDLLHPERPVALKTIHRRFLGAEHLSLFKSEFKTLADLRHPNVATVYDFEPARGSGETFFTMEYVAGRDLMTATEGASVERIVDVLVQTCRALSFLHSRGIIHCDIKPANILVDDDDRVRVLDFGVASAGTVSSVRGTPAYMAPELFTDDVPVDHRVDLYSLGIVAYQIITRRPPFVAASLAEMLALHASAPVELPVDAPAALRHVVERLTAKDPAGRYRSANAVIADLNGLLGVRHELETAATRESYILSGRFVGREGERDQVMGHIWRATSPRVSPGPAALLVGGPSGAGKTRLVRECRLLAQLAGLHVVEASCYEGGLAELAPAADALAQVIRLARAAGAGALVADYADALARVDPVLVPGHAADAGAEDAGDGKPEGQRLALLDRLSELLVRVAEHAPYVLHLGDLQWARPALVDLLHNLILRVAQRARAAQATRLAIVGTYRSDEARPIAKLLALESAGEVATLVLGPLRPTDVERLVGSMLGIDALPPAFVDRVARETEGNPFFVEEVMRSLVDRGAVYLDRGAWAASAEIGELEIPASIARVFRRRTALLDDGARRTLELLAIYGRPVAAGLLARLAGATEDETYRALRTLIEREMVVRVAGTPLAYRIGHDRMRETVHDDLASEARARRHGEIATALELEPGGLAAHLYELAHHAWLAGDADRALRTSLLAGDRATEDFANELAMEHYGHALTLLGADPRRLEIEEKLADIELLTGRYGDAAARYQRLLTATPGPFARARLLRKTGELNFERGDIERSVDPLWTAVTLLGERRPTTAAGWMAGTAAALATHLAHRVAGRPRASVDAGERASLRERCAAYSALARSYFLFVDPRRMVTLMLRACNLGERLGDSRELGRSYAELGFLYGYLGMQGSARTFGLEALAMAERRGSSLDIGRACVFHGMSLINGGESLEAIPLLLRGRELLGRHGDVLTYTIAETNIGHNLCAQGRIREAADSAEEVMQLVERTGSQAYGKSVLATLGSYRGLLGDDARADACFAESFRLAVASKDRFGEFIALGFRGDLEHARGDDAAAVATLAQVREALARSGSKLYVLAWVLPALALAQLEVAPPGPLARGTRRAIAAVVAEALRYTRRRPQRRASAVLADAVFRWRLGERETVRPRFDEAIALANLEDHHLTATEVRLELGRALARDGRRDEARPLLERAALELERFEAAPLVARARAALAAL